MVIFNFTEMNFLEYSVKGILLSAEPRHLWYLMALFCIFVGCTFLRDVIKKANIVVCLIIVFLIPYIAVRIGTPYFQIINAMYYVPYFYIGYLLNRYWGKIEKSIHKIKIVLIFVCPFGVILGMRFQQLKYVASISGIIMMITISLCATDFIYENKIYIHLKKNSFGIYLFHPMIIYILFYYFGSRNINPFVLSFAIFLIAFIVSDLLTEFIRKIKLGVILGE